LALLVQEPGIGTKVETPRSDVVTTATLDDPERCAPTKEIWLSQKLSWATWNPNVEHRPQESQGMEPP
jgi:hypothetical protein